ncbi:MAG TPA: hypothetical protein DEB09_05455 [Candidatus Magasanikbacteria bacterium]|nr:hypothetical protein [Candidatus Magasanikbacteria bacterium]
MNLDSFILLVIVLFKGVTPSTPIVQESFSLVFSNIEFEAGRVTLTEKSRAILDDIARELRCYPGIKVRVEGHTDGREVVGFNANLVLSQERALKVLVYLTTQGGMPSSLLDYRGYGAELPISGGYTTSAREKNRHVEFHVTDISTFHNVCDE